ncbi:hypothetical protein RUM43_008911 [Polyplax serrata]|uniref:Uncharacterized protein n=1 Tax=Polyplax serrata TaxID=468196 RepID=A0AAN8RU26_POLSC
MEECPGKEAVHKCNSDPGGKKDKSEVGRFRGQSASRKCILTLDGYSYVIGAENCWFTVLSPPTHESNSEMLLIKTTLVFIVELGKSSSHKIASVHISIASNQHVRRVLNLRFTIARVLSTPPSHECDTLNGDFN